MKKNTIRPDLNCPETRKQYLTVHWEQLAIVTVGSITHPLGTEHVINETVIRTVAQHYKHTYSLLAKPLSHITDEDALVCASLLGNCSHLSDESKIAQIKELIGTNNFYTKQTNITANQWLKVFDYLRHNRYALPWNGWPVEELVEAGYCQLKGVEGE